MSPKQEILPPAINDRSEADRLIKIAVDHFRTARKATIQTMADLRRLQNADVHVLYGYKNFAKWAEDRFEGLAANNVRQLCRSGAVALELDRRKLIDLENPKGVGTTALRELATISGSFGDDKMAEVFVTARGMLEGKTEVSNVTVDAAMKLLMPPAEIESFGVEPDLEAELEADPYDDDGTEYSDKVRELMERIRDLSWDLPETAEELKEAVVRLQDQMTAESGKEDQTWIEGTR
jgi:hypothetical protein